MTLKKSLTILSKVPAKSMVAVTILPYVEYEPEYTKICTVAAAIKHLNEMYTEAWGEGEDRMERRTLGDKVVSIYELGAKLKA